MTYSFQIVGCLWRTSWASAASPCREPAPAMGEVENLTETLENDIIRTGITINEYDFHCDEKESIVLIKGLE